MFLKKIDGPNIDNFRYLIARLKSCFNMTSNKDVKPKHLDELWFILEQFQKLRKSKNNLKHVYLRAMFLDLQQEQL